MKFLALMLSVLMALSACEMDAKQPAKNQTETISEPSEDADNNHTVYEIGDIILSDGSAVKTIAALDENNLPVAVIAGFQENGAAFGIGVHRSSEPLQWAPDGTPGNSVKFTDIVCTDSAGGDTDGSDNWDAVCSADPQGTTDAAANYPAFHFINTYAETYQLPESCTSGWYMPSIAEVCIVYDNRAAIDASLQAIHVLDNDAAMDGLGTVWYWASSQSDENDDYAWFEHYFNGYAACCPKDFDNLHVIAAHTF